jgi:hypothetical protein
LIETQRRKGAKVFLLLATKSTKEHEGHEELKELALVPVSVIKQ